MKKSVVILLLAIGFVINSVNGDAGNNGKLTLTIQSVDQTDKSFSGMWVEIKSGTETIHSGFTPLSFNATAGTEYTVYVSNYGNHTFDQWEDGNKDYFRTIKPVDDAILTAYYLDTSIAEIPNSDQPLVGLSHLVSATKTESVFPSWIKNVAKMWADGQVSDADFISTLQWLIDQKILIVPQATEEAHVTEEPQEVTTGFSNIQCTQGIRWVQMTGKYTNGDTAYDLVSLRLVLLDSDGRILATGSGVISDIGVYQTKYFDVTARYHAEFTKCDIQVESVIPKSNSNH